MTPRQWLLYLIPIAYVVGSIPFGLLVGFCKGVDVRKAGSGNIGATNVGRLLGRRFFFVVFFLDLLKGLGMMLLAGIFAARMGNTMSACALWLAVGLAAVIGHGCSLFLKFKGGKGVSTSIGAVLGVWPYLTLPGIAALIVFCVVLYLTRYISVSSMIGASTIPVVYLMLGLRWDWHPFGQQLPLMIFSVLIAAMIVLKHRGNIARLRAGTEPRVGRAAHSSV